MAENKRFTVDYDVTTGNYDIHDKKKSNGVGGYIAYLPHEEQANLICDLLNEQEERIKQLEKENKQLQIDIMGQSEEIEILSDENTRLKQGKYIYEMHGGSNDRK